MSTAQLRLLLADVVEDLGRLERRLELFDNAAEETAHDVDELRARVEALEHELVVKGAAP